ncbi:chromate transporter [Paracoccus sp. (in: a-proteobacteria)]|uniref:chromate transporter n=1 Tax=Paracoccus sp. TaxID=267 RepID=UPI00289835A7|nr:chromate transporter [Paracoccus sp. (in: a-proteobacteria)]
MTILEQSTSPPAIALKDIFWAFFKLGSVSFGGGSLGWITREVVERRKWIAEDEFMNLLTVALTMPGANPVNLAVSTGMYLRGYRGAAIAAAGMILPPFVMILVLGSLYTSIRDIPHVHAVLAGLTSVGLAAMLTTGLKSARRLGRNPVPILTAAAVFVSVGILRWPMVWVVCIAIPASIAAHILMAKVRPYGN